MEPVLTGGVVCCKKMPSAIEEAETEQDISSIGGEQR
jgi:hypothetical protein